MYYSPLPLPPRPTPYLTPVEAPARPAAAPTTQRPPETCVQDAARQALGSREFPPRPHARAQDEPGQGRAPPPVPAEPRVVHAAPGPAGCPPPPPPKLPGRGSPRTSLPGRHQWFRRSSASNPSPHREGPATRPPPPQGAGLSPPARPHLRRGPQSPLPPPSPSPSPVARWPCPETSRRCPALAALARKAAAAAPSRFK